MTLMTVMTFMTFMTHGNVIIDIIEPPAFRKYSTCWVLGNTLYTFIHHKKPHKTLCKYECMILSHDGSKFLTAFPPTSFKQF